MSIGPLDGFVVGVTADRQASEQAELLRRRGAGVILGPTGAVRAAGLDVWRSAANEQMDQLLGHLLAEELSGACVAVQLYGIRAPEVTSALVAAGAEVLEVPVYEWRTPADPGPGLRLAQAVVDGRVHAVTFTAAPAVTNLFAVATEAGVDERLRDAFNRRGVVAACVGPVCARGALEAGILAPLVPDVGRLGLMIRALSERLVCDRRTVPMAGVDVVLQGLMALVGETRVRLNSRERALLDTLATRPGIVFSRPALVRDVWSTTGADPHAVEVAIARLRPRLGPAGVALVAVPGRGYRLEP